MPIDEHAVHGEEFRRIFSRVGVDLTAHEAIDEWDRYLRDVRFLM